MKKQTMARSLSVIAMLVAILTVALAFGVPASAADVNYVGDQDALIAALAAGGDVQLTADIQLTKTVTIPVAANTTLSSKTGEGPYTITRSTTVTFPMLTVNSGVTLTLTNITLDGGGYPMTSNFAGGAIKNSGTTVLETGTTIQNFYAQRGGAVSGGTIAVMPGCLITGNSTSNGGSALHGTIWMVGGTIENNHSTGKTGYAGTILLDSGNKFVMRGGVIQNNTAVAGASVVDFVRNGTIYWIGGSIINNSSNGVSDQGVPACAIALRNLTATWAGFKAGVNNTSSEPAATQGIGSQGPIQFYGNGEIGISYGTNTRYTIDPVAGIKTSGIPAGSRLDYSYTTVVDPATETKYYHADILSAATHAATLEGAVVEVTCFGEGVATLPEGTYTINGAGNTFTRVESGVSMFTLPAGANVTFTNITLDGNSIAANGENGGAFNVAAGATLTLNAGTTVQNFVAAKGDAIYTEGVIAIEDASFVNNDVYVALDTFALADGSADTFEKNGDAVSFEWTTKGDNVISITMPNAFAATNNGTVYNTLEGVDVEGALVLKYIDLSAGTFTIPTGTYTIDGDGKTLYRAVAGVSMFTVPAGTNVTFTNITLDGNSIAANGEKGGAFNVAEGATLTLTGKDAAKVTIRGFEAVLGGAIYTNGTLNVTDAVITGNKATSTTSNSGGGGIGAGYGATVTIDGATEITGNSAVTAGGGIGAIGAQYKAEINVTVKGNTKIDGNTAKLGGGACISSYSTMTLSGNAVLSNNVGTDKYGGGIYIPAGIVIVEENASITGNYLTLKAWAVGEGVSMQNGTFVMTGGSITNNGKGGADSYDNWHHGGALYATNESKIWILGGTISGNAASNTGGAFAVSHADAKFYMLGGTVTGNFAGGTSANKVGNAPALITSGQSYLLGGSIVGNGINTTKQGAYVADIVASKAVHLGSSVTPESIPAAVTAFAATEAGQAILEIVDGTVISKNTLTIKDGGVGATGTTVPKNLSGNIYVADLVKGSAVVFEDNTADVGYFATLETGYESLNADTLDAIQLRGADAAYNATVSGTTLVWPTDVYFVKVNAVLGSDIGFRVTYVRRNAADETLLDDVSVALTTKVYDEEGGSWIAKPAVPYYSEQTHNGSPCIMISLAPRQIMDEIKVTKGENEKTYTLNEYLAQLTDDATYGKLAQATIDYCTAAQVYFNYNAEVLANPAYANSLKPVDAENAMTLTNDNDQYFHSAQVDVGSKVSMIIAVDANAKIASISSKLVCNENNPTTDVAGKTYRIFQFENINATDLTKTVTIELEGGATLIYSVPAYAYNMQTKGAEANLVALVQALNAYAIAAEPFGAN